MLYLERSPAAALRPWVRKLWYCRAPGIARGRERVLPNGCIQIVLNLHRDYLTDTGADGAAAERQPQAIIQGVRSRYEVIETADLEDLAGVVIEPGGFPGLFHERADLLFDTPAALDDFWRGRSLLENLQSIPRPEDKLVHLEQALLRLLRGTSRRSAIADQALHLLRRRDMSVAACARSIGVSERRLSQVFREEVGASPKLWFRIGRFQAALRRLHGGGETPWVEVALDCGYYDQSHFANDFRAFSGIDATTYTAQVGRWKNHVTIS